jgi:hypothetical protein
MIDRCPVCDKDTKLYQAYSGAHIIGCSSVDFIDQSSRMNWENHFVIFSSDYTNQMRIASGNYFWWFCIRRRQLAMHKQYPGRAVEGDQSSFISVMMDKDYQISSIDSLMSRIRSMEESALFI